MQGQYSLRSPAVKRLMKEAQELNEPTEQYYAQPLEDNLFEWHFTIRGPQDSEFDGGIYHGRIILPPEYPMKPPNIVLLTPNGRFETFKKICLSISGYHPESWQPSWSIRTALLAIIGFMPTHGNGAIGSLDYTPEERKKLARKSQDFKCEVCGSIRGVLPELTEKSKETEREAKHLASQMSFHGEKEKPASVSSDDSKTPVQGGEVQNTNLDESQVYNADQLFNPPNNDSSNTTNGASGQTDENKCSANENEGSGSVRQRNIQRTSSTSGNDTPATVARQPQASGGTGSLALIVVLTLAIGLLLFRRLYITGNLSLPRL